MLLNNWHWEEGKKLLVLMLGWKMVPLVFVLVLQKDDGKLHSQVFGNP